MMASISLKSVNTLLSRVAGIVDGITDKDDPAFRRLAFLWHGMDADEREFRAVMFQLWGGRIDDRDDALDFARPIVETRIGGSHGFTADRVLAIEGSPARGSAALCAGHVVFMGPVPQILKQGTFAHAAITRYAELRLAAEPAAVIPMGQPELAFARAAAK